LILDTLSSEGLEVWQDERKTWRGQWRATALRSERGFWALGEALVDAVIARYPTALLVVLAEIRRTVVGDQCAWNAVAPVIGTIYCFHRG